MTTQAYAHSHEKYPQNPEQWEPLIDHLRLSAQKAEEFAAPFGCGKIGFLLGLLHDVGKNSKAFQTYLSKKGKGESGGKKVDHSSAGALWVRDHVTPDKPEYGHFLSYVLASHHSGLLDGNYFKLSNNTLRSRLDKQKNEGEKERSWKPQEGSPLAQELEKALELAPRAFEEWEQFSQKNSQEKKEFNLFSRVFSESSSSENSSLEEPAFALSFWIRMMFSCLVDADCLATESFMNEEKSQKRQELLFESSPLPAMAEALELFLARKEKKAPRSMVNTWRSRVSTQCLEKAALEPGLFSLTVPTGGGKTLASLRFALQHAIAHGMERIVYVIPYTSIIEQTAEVFREVFEELSRTLGTELVLEHHSQVLLSRKDAPAESDSSQEGDTGSAQELFYSFACENWDVPLIVTTSVQFFESLFGRKTSVCRKLHRLAKSVIILDEAQKLPIDYLKPCLGAIRELCSYGSSLVLCTATQPALEKRKDFSIGLEGVREIIGGAEIDPQELFSQLSRVKAEWFYPDDPFKEGGTSQEELVARLAKERQVLCIIDDRAQINELYGALSAHREEGECVVLTTFLCPAHRLSQLNQVKERLKEGRPCLVIATSLVEAGVDIDFPVVYRVLAGVDSLVQAAGRCNREGRWEGGGRLVIFCPPKESSCPSISSAAGSAKEVYRLVLKQKKKALKAGLVWQEEDWLSLSFVERYFSLYYWEKQEEMDEKSIVHSDNINSFKSSILTTPGDNFWHCGYQTIAESFKLIEEETFPVIIPWDETAKASLKIWEDALSADKWNPALQRECRRRLQRYTVGLYPYEYEALDKRKGINKLKIARKGVQEEEGVDVLVENLEEYYHPVLGVITRANEYQGQSNVADYIK